MWHNNLMKVRLRSSKKGQISNFINFNKKYLSDADYAQKSDGALFCYATSVTCSNMHLNYKYFTILCIQKIEMSYVSHFLTYQTETFNTDSS